MASEDQAGGPERRHRELGLPSEPGAARTFRAVLRDCCQDWDLHPARCDIALLLGSELITNAVLHGEAPLQMTVDVEGDLLRLAMSDTGPRRPVARPAPLQASGGRGLHLLTALSEAWGVREHPDGKSVWCSIALTNG